MKISSISRLYAVGVLLWSGVLSAAVSVQNPQIRYDLKQDRLSIQAQDVALKTIMTRIAFVSGIEVMIDPAVDRTVSANFKDESLEEGIRRITRGLNTIYQYSSKKPNSKSLLIGARLLPSGKSDTSALVPVMSLEQEAVIRTMNQAGVAQQGTRLHERWNLRLQNLPSAQRQYVLDSAQAQRKKLEERRRGHAQDRKEDELEFQQTLKEIEKEDLELRESDPERYRLRQQRRQEVENALRQPPLKR
ncbi:MAG: hypothetical protein HY272_07020 [Gammaproteobacteria bacterium]|nr:hypothetical protein [Gammaproteobacteria bacterium]